MTQVVRVMWTTCGTGSQDHVDLFGTGSHGHMDYM